MKSFRAILILMIMMLPFLLSPAIYSEGTAPLSPADYEDEVEREIRLEMEKEEREKVKGLTAEERKARSKRIQEEIGAEDSQAVKAMKLQRNVRLEKLSKLPPIKMVSVTGGCFQMGDFTGSGDDDERPVHKVCVADYNISEVEVTQELWKVVRGWNPLPRYAWGTQKPVANVSWIKVGEFIRELNIITGRFYRLPSEAEWEYAAREGGKDILWSGTNDESRVSRYAWFQDNAQGTFHAVKSKRPNALGIYDMTGNVWEWVDDNFAFEYYQTSPVDDPYGPENAMWKTIRGGSIINDVYQSRTTFRYAGEAPLPNKLVGFRLAE